jgi:predicted AAA+ superfamily ATPase
MNYLEEGGFPETALEKNQELNRQRLREYYNSILFRDIVAARQIKESAKLSDLATYAATNMASSFSYNSVSKAIGLNNNTLKEYMHFLEEAYLLFEIDHFSYSLKESISMQKPKKTGFIDNGMRNSIAARFSPDTGKLAENTVFLELKRRGFEVCFWKGKNEVDYVAKDPSGSLHAINVTYGPRIEERETKGLHEFRENFPRTGLLMITKDTEKTEDGIKHAPLWKWLLGI